MNLEFDDEMEPINYLHTGDITCLYQHGKLRYVRYKGEEVIRMVYTAIRDENWNTAPYEISDETIQQGENGFQIMYTATYQMREIHYRAKVNISAEGNEVSVEFSGEALSDFKRNRIGLCVLHTVSSISEKDVSITTPSGNTYIKKFPQLISPHQPAKDITSMNWNTGTCDIEIRFEGDVFENEDQRNWTDSSFKTYSTPLEIPIPAEVHKGDQVKQSLQFSIKDASTNDNEGSRKEKTRRWQFPSVGYTKVKEKELSRQEISALSEILFDHYRVELHLSEINWTKELQVAVKEARQLNTVLQVTAIFDPGHTEQVLALRQSLESIHHLVESVLIVDSKTNRTNDETFHQVYDRIKPAFPNIKLGYGTTNHFADLNRNLPKSLPFDFVSFGITPQAHSTDTMSLMENLDNQGDIIDSLYSHLGEVEIHVSPITFKGRKSNLFAEHGTHPDYDERQHIQLGAGWIIKTLKNFAGTSVSLFDAAGYKGILSGDHFTKGPSPIYKLMRELKKFEPASFVATGSESNELVLENKDGKRFEIRLDERFNAYRSFKQQR